MTLFNFTVQSLPTNSGNDNIAFQVVIDASYGDSSLNEIADKFVATLTTKNGASDTIAPGSDGFQSATVQGPFAGQDVVKIDLLKDVSNAEVAAGTTYVVAVSGYKNGAKISGPAAKKNVTYENAPIQGTDYTFGAAGQDSNLIVTLTDISGSANSLTSAIIQLISMDASADILNETVYLGSDVSGTASASSVVYSIDCSALDQTYPFRNGTKYETAVFGRNSTGSTRTVEPKYTTVNSGANNVSIGTAVQPAKDAGNNNIFTSFTLPVSFNPVTGQPVTDLSGTISDGSTSVAISFDISNNTNDAAIVLGFTSGTTDISGANYQLKNLTLNAASEYTVSLIATNAAGSSGSVSSSAVPIEAIPTWNLSDNSLNDALTNVDLLLDKVIVAKLSNISSTASVFYNAQGSDVSSITLSLFDGSDNSLANSQTIAASALTTDVSFTDISNVSNNQVYLKATLLANLDNGSTATSATLDASGNKTSVVNTDASFTSTPSLTNDSEGNLTLSFTLDGRGLAHVDQITSASIEYYVDTSNNSSNETNNTSYLSIDSSFCSDASFAIANATYSANGPFFTGSGESLIFEKKETLNQKGYGHKYYAKVTANTANGDALTAQLTSAVQSVVDASISMIDVSGDVFTATRNGNALNTAIGLIPDGSGMSVEVFSDISAGEINFQLSADASNVQVGTTLLTSSVDISGANPDFLVAFGFGSLKGVVNEAGNLVNAFSL